MLKFKRKFRRQRVKELLAVEMLIRYICIDRSGMPYRIHVPPFCVNTPACIGRVLFILLEHVLSVCLQGLSVCVGGKQRPSVL